MLAFAYGAAGIADLWWGAGLLHGLKLMAVAVIAQAVLGMAKTFCADAPRAAIAAAALAAVAFVPGSLAQLAAIVGGAVAGLAAVRGAATEASDDFGPHLSRRAAFAALALLLALLALSFLPAGAGLAALAAAFYRSGALVFGGGHVVLPLLRDALVAPGLLPQSAFLAGYGAAQALPGPLFAVAADFGALAGTPPAGLVGGVVALAAIFLPGMLALAAALPFWRALRRETHAQNAMAGINAAVVGLLAAALYNPAFVSAVLSPRDFAVATAAFALLVAGRAPPLLVAALAAAAGVALAA
jgi:chromate transporter